MSETGEPAPARPVKSAAAFRTIGEVADDLDLPPHVLRFWESKFPQLKPLKRGGGRRYYRPEDIVLLRRIRQCLYQDGYTIRGVQKLLGDLPASDGGSGDSPAPAPDGGAQAMPNLFPLEAAAEPPDEAQRPPRPARVPRRRPTRPEDRAALEDIRRELLEARAQLTELLRRTKPS